MPCPVVTHSSCLRALQAGRAGEGSCCCVCEGGSSKLSQVKNKVNSSQCILQYLLLILLLCHFVTNIT